MSQQTNPRSNSALARRSFTAGMFAIAIIGPALADSAPSAATLIRPGDPILGNPNGDVTIIEFYDIRCPFCRAMYPHMKKLLATDKKLRFVPVDYPVLGPASLLGTQALFAAQIQHKYAPLRARLLTEPAPPTMASIQADAKSLGLDWEKMEFDMSGDVVAAHVEANLARGRALKLQGVPATYINSIFAPGGLDYADLVDIVATARKRESDVTNGNKSSS